jgi:hypothetical protein
MRVGEIVGERFELLEEAAVGGMGTVYRARDLESGRAVAVKVLRSVEPVEQERFAREAALLADLVHPAIVRYIAHGGHGGLRYLVEEWLEGTTLAQRLLGEGVTAAETVLLARQIAGALAEAHRRAIVHRDVKPDNIVLVGDAIAAARLIDFGVARRADGSQTRLTVSGAVVGTPGYMAPEQARGDRTIGVRADTFALGCVIYECLAGRPAFTGQNLMAARTKVLFSEPADLHLLAGHAPAKLVSLVKEMMAKDAQRRPSDDGLAEALDAVEPPAADERRRAGTATSATVALARAAARAEVVPHLCVILASPREDGGQSDLGPATFAQRERALREMAGAFGARVELLEDHAVAMTLSGGEPDARVVQAARCALAVSALLPGSTVALASAAPDAAIEELIDRGIHALELAALDATIGGSGGGVRLDETSARLLDAEFSVSRTAPGRFLLVGER